MSDFDPLDPGRAPSPAQAVRWVVGCIAGLLLLGALAFAWLLQASPPPPAAIAADPLLVRGFEIYSARCVSCHGTSGRGDGPIAKGLSGPPPRNLVEDRWKYGDAPGQVLAVLNNGIKDSAMPAWGGTYEPPDLKAVAAYVYHLAERPIPRELHAP